MWLLVQQFVPAKVNEKIKVSYGCPFAMGVHLLSMYSIRKCLFPRKVFPRSDELNTASCMGHT